MEKALQRASIWDEVKDRLHDSAIGLSGGQQQRVCVARVLATSPKLSSWMSRPQPWTLSQLGKSKKPFRSQGQVHHALGHSFYAASISNL